MKLYPFMVDPDFFIRELYPEHPLFVYRHTDNPIILMEDTYGAPGCEYEHGLSVYIETTNHKVLMDTGASMVIIPQHCPLHINRRSLIDLAECRDSARMVIMPVA